MGQCNNCIFSNGLLGSILSAFIMDFLAAFYSKKTYSFAITKAPFIHFNLFVFCFRLIWILFSIHVYFILICIRNSHFTFILSNLIPCTVLYSMTHFIFISCYFTIFDSYVLQSFSKKPSEQTSPKNLLKYLSVSQIRSKGIDRMHQGIMESLGIIENHHFESCYI